jgi:hypothetical protein
MTDLGDLIRDHLAANPFETDEVIARGVVDATPDHQVVEFYTTAVRRLVADYRRLARNEAVSNALSENPPDFHQPRTRSRKVSSIRTWWAMMLESSVKLGDGAYHLLGDCTLDDIDYLISDREARAVELQKKAAEYQRLRDHMVDSGVKRLRDAPELHSH